MQFPRNHRLFEIFDKKLQQLFEGGIIYYYLDEVLKYLNPKRYEHLYRDKPKVLTIKHLEAGFVIWIISVSTALAAFMFEWLIKFYEYLIVKYVLEEFYKKKHPLRSRDPEDNPDNQLNQCR